MGVRINNLVKDFPFVYICDGREECDNFVYLFYDKKEELDLTSSDDEIFESVFGFLPKEFISPNSYTSAFLVNVLETSERFERVNHPRLKSRACNTATLNSASGLHTIGLLIEPCLLGT